MSYVCYLCLVMYSTVKYYMSNREAVTAYPSGPPGFTPRFLLGSFVGVRVPHLFIFLCCVFCFVCLHPVSCVAMLSVSLDCPFLIAPSVFSNIYLSKGCLSIGIVGRHRLRIRLKRIRSLGSTSTTGGSCD